MKIKSRPTYSVVIRTKNSSSTIQLCIQCLLQQTILPEKIFIVDSGSTDSTLENVSNYLNTEVIKYPENFDFNYSKAINLGVEKVESDFVLICSSHVELFHNKAVEWMISFFLDSQVVASSIGWGGDRHKISHHRIQKKDLKFKIIDSTNFSGYAMTNMCSLIRVESWKMKPFNEQILRCEDLEWSLFNIKNGKSIVFINSKLHNYLNTHYSSKKEYWDFIYIDKYVIKGFISPKLIKSQKSKSLSYLRKGKLKLFLHHFEIWLRLFFKIYDEDKIKSEYF